MISRKDMHIIRSIVHEVIIEEINKSAIKSDFRPIEKEKKEKTTKGV